MREALDLARLHVLALDQARQLLIGTLVLLGAAAPLAPGVGGALPVDAAPAGHDQELAAGAEDVLAGALAAGGGDGGLHAGVLEHGLGMEDGEEAPRGEVVDATVVVAHALDSCARRGWG